MRRLNFETDESSRQLAIDEAMLIWADEQDEGVDTSLLRFWQFAKPTVVLGRSSKIAEEVDETYCRSNSIEILRRCTGGASVVGGPGCLMYSVVLRLTDDLSLRKIDVAHRYVMSRVLAAIHQQHPTAEHLGTCDLTLDQRKFSGNSLRIARHHLLYHGTLLIDADLDQIARCLGFAPRQPDYRNGREHRDFVTNLPLDPDKFQHDLSEQFGVSPTLRGDAERIASQIEDRSQDLWKTRYQNAQWHRRH